ncbi:MAG: HemK family protein methyltransferase [Chloroflexi bacterium]|nr:HemK family protein methyltransferase [Chloroflexota bacterium]
MGTGSGAIAIALAAHLPTARIYATDVSAAALTVAPRNVQLHGVADRIVLLEGDLLSSLPEPVDAIVANLPYVPSEELEALQREVSEHEPRLALDGGPDGLDMYRRLLPQVLQYLRSSGFLVLEIGAGQGDLIEAIAAGYLPGSKIEIRPDFAGISRVVKIAVAAGR